MNEKYLSRNVRKETREHYIHGWPLSADVRRNLYLKYASPAPGLDSDIGPQERRDVWREVADIVLDEVGDDTNIRGVDVGVSSGYFVEKLLERGYKGRLVGVDIATDHMPFLQDFLSSRYQADILLGKSDAQSLREIEVSNDEDTPTRIESIPPNSFDFLTELFVLYHVEEPQKALAAAHRALKPGGLAVFSCRGGVNQQHLWRIGSITADNFHAMQPDSFYTHYSLEQMEQELAESDKFKIIYSSEQADNLWIPATDEGWADYRLAILSLLPLMKNRVTGRQLSGVQVGNFLDENVRPVFFDPQAKKNDGYFIDYVHQAYFVCKAIK